MDKLFFPSPFLNLVQEAIVATFLGLMINMSFAQEYTSGSIIYDVYEGNYTSEVGQNIFNLGNGSANQDDYWPKSILLEFNGNSSYCMLTPESTISNNNWSKFKESSLELMGETFYSISDKELLTTYDDYGTLYLISKKDEEIQWDLKEGAKTILGYSCKKAVRRIMYRRNSQSWVVDYVAWYAPGIAVPFGPFDHVNLPGLVLEVEKTGGHTEFRYVARAIDVDRNDSLIINKPSKGVPITQREYDRKLRDRLNELFGGK